LADSVNAPAKDEDVGPHAAKVPLLSGMGATSLQVPCVLSNVRPLAAVPPNTYIAEPTATAA
jgi:hypothetical protein